MSLGGGEHPLGDEQSTSDTHELISTTHRVAFWLVATNIGGNGGLVRRVLMSARSGCVCADPKFSLGAESQQLSHGNDITHVKDMKDPIEFQLPGGNRLLIVLGVIASGDRVPFTPFDGILLDLCDSPG